MEVNGVFEGGGVKGCAFSGCLVALEQNKYSFKNVVGASAGSIIACLVALKYSPQEIFDIMFDLNYKEMMDCHIKIPLIGKYINFLKNKGLYDGDYIQEWIFDLCKKKGKTTFGDIMDENGNSPLKVIWTDMTLKRMVVVPDDIQELYNINPKELDISFSIRASISIPFFFRPVILKYKNNIGQDMESFLVDGGCENNYPIFIFDEKENPTTPTLGFNLDGQKYNLINTKTSLKEYASDLIDAIIDRNEDVYLRDKDSVRTIDIRTNGVSATNFNITRGEVLNLYDNGYHATKQYLESDDFKNYIAKYNK